MYHESWHWRLDDCEWQDGEVQFVISYCHQSYLWVSLSPFMILLASFGSGLVFTNRSSIFIFFTLIFLKIKHCLTLSLILLLCIVIAIVGECIFVALCSMMVARIRSCNFMIALIVKMLKKMMKKNFMIIFASFFASLISLLSTWAFS